MIHRRAGEQQIKCPGRHRRRSGSKNIAGRTASTLDLRCPGFGLSAVDFVRCREAKGPKRGAFQTLGKGQTCMQLLRRSALVSMQLQKHPAGDLIVKFSPSQQAATVGVTICLVGRSSQAVSIAYDEWYERRSTIR
jgi:hypothetical protein